MTPVTAVYAAQNPFKDLPQDHWAYDAVTMLAKDGVIDGYQDGTYKGERNLNRYEMAAIVARALEKFDTAKPADKGALRKLKREFANELSDIDERLSAVESDASYLKKIQSSFKWYGDARIRFFQNKDNKMTHPNTYWGNLQAGKEKQFEKRLRLGMYAEPAKNLVVDGRLKYEDSSFVHSGAQYDNTPANANLNTWDNSDRNQNSVRLDKLSLKWTNAGTTLVVGRNEFNLGQGLLWWENSMDGAYVSHGFGPRFNLMAGWGDMAAEGWHDVNMPAYFANAEYKASKATKFTVAMLRLIRYSGGIISILPTATAPSRAATTAGAMVPAAGVLVRRSCWRPIPTLRWLTINSIRMTSIGAMGITVLLAVMMISCWLHCRTASDVW